MSQVSSHLRAPVLNFFSQLAELAGRGLPEDTTPFSPLVLIAFFFLPQTAHFVFLSAPAYSFFIEDLCKGGTT